MQEVEKIDEVQFNIEQAYSGISPAGSRQAARLMVIGDFVEKNPADRSDSVLLESEGSGQKFLVLPDGTVDPA